MVKRQDKLPRGIRMRGTSYQVDVTVAGKRQTGTASTLVEAVQLQADLKAGKTHAAPLPVECWTLGHAWDHTYRTVWAGSRSDLEMVKMRKQVVGYFGEDRVLDTLTAVDLDEWVVTLQAKGNSGGTINRKLAALSKVMTEATRRPDSGYLVKPYIRKQREAKGRIRQVSPVEEATLLGTLSQWGKQDHRDAVVVLLDTGMRCGELFSIQDRDLGTIPRPSVSIWETKADHPRTIPLTSRAAEVLKRRAAGLAPNDRLFPFDNRWLAYEWDRVRQVMDLEDDKQFVPHICRHTFACRLIQKGVGIVAVKDLLGHKNIQTTMRYARASAGNLYAAVAMLESAPEQPQVVVPLHGTLEETT